MANINTTVKQLYNCDGSVDTFAIPFFLLEGEESVIKVYLVDDATEVATLLVLNTNYTVDSPATEVTTILTYPSGKSILLKRVSPLIQASEFIQGPFPFESVEEQFDRVVSMIQEIDDAQASQVSLPEGTSLTELVMPVPEANKLIGWNATADGLENKDELDVAALQAEIDAVEVRMTAAELDINNLQANDTIQDSDINTAQADIISLDGRVDTLETNYTALGATVANQADDIDDLQDQIDLIDDRGADVDQLIIDVNAVEVRLDALEPVSTDHETRINQLEAASDISVFSGSALLLNNQAVALEIPSLDRDADGTQLAEVTIQIQRRTDSEKRYARINLLMQYVDEDLAWYIQRVNTVVVAGEPDGVTFSIDTDPLTNVGQISYVSDNMAGANYSGIIKFVGKEIPTGV